MRSLRMVLALITTPAMAEKLPVSAAAQPWLRCALEKADHASLKGIHPDAIVPDGAPNPLWDTTQAIVRLCRPESDSNQNLIDRMNITNRVIERLATRARNRSQKIRDDANVRRNSI